MATDPQTRKQTQTHTHTQTHPQTGPITIHCTAASAQCNCIVAVSYDIDALTLLSVQSATKSSSNWCAYPRRDGQAELTGAHPDTNRARRQVNWLIETGAMPNHRLGNIDDSDSHLMALRLTCLIKLVSLFLFNKLWKQKLVNSLYYCLQNVSTEITLQ